MGRRFGSLKAVEDVSADIARGDVLYTASKGGLAALTRALTAVLGPIGITVNAVAPGYFATDANAAMVEDPAIAAHLARRHEVHHIEIILRRIHRGTVQAQFVLHDRGLRTLAVDDLL